MSASCPFCAIASRAASATRLGETANVSFLDASPVTPGHALVISRAHCEDLRECEPHVLAELIIEARRVGAHLIEQQQATGFNILSANGHSAQQSVKHVHLHVVPRRDGDGLDLWLKPSSLARD